MGVPRTPDEPSPIAVFHAPRRSPKPAMTQGKHLFRSFWSGGFECSTDINSRGVRLDMTAGVQHDVCAAEDYRMLRETGILTARDGLRWHLIDKGGRLDWSSW